MGKRKNRRTVLGCIRPMAFGLEAVTAWSVCYARCTHVHDVRGHRGRHTHDGEAHGGSPAAGLKFGLHFEHHGGAGDPPGNSVRTGPQPSDGAAWRLRFRSGGAAVDGGGGAWLSAVTRCGLL
jgi:hypothetical protein